mgnify:CR=1 FL=1
MKSKLEHANNCTLIFYDAQQAWMPGDGLGKVFYYLQAKKQCLFMGVFAKAPLVIF